MSVKEEGIAGLLKSGSFRKFVIDFRRRIVSVTELRCKVQHGLHIYKGFFGCPRQR